MRVEAGSVLGFCKAARDRMFIEVLKRLKRRKRRDYY